MSGDHVQAMSFPGLVKALRAEIALRDETIRQLEAALQPALIYPKSLGLTTHQQKIVSLLYGRAPRVVRHETIIRFCLRFDDKPPNVEIIKVHVCNIRRALRGTGVEIENQFNAGYAMPKESAAILRALCG